MLSTTSRVSNGEYRMSLSWIANRSLKVSPKARLVADDESAALRRKLESLDWKPSNGFLKDQVVDRSQLVTGQAGRAA
jgi:hypothetical protein